MILYPFIEDWDNPIFAPKEQDLILIGGSYIWKGTREETLFFQGYGKTEIDRTALAYDRYERIIQDIAAFCEQLFLTAKLVKTGNRPMNILQASFCQITRWRSLSRPMRA
jgi:hypothetical protein